MSTTSSASPTTIGARAPVRDEVVTAIRRGFGAVGLEVRRARPHPWRPEGVAIAAGTILDVGAADGTPELYAAFPDAHLVAFDPIPEQLERLRRSVESRESVELIEVALGSSPGRAELHIPTARPLKSSLHTRTALTAESGDYDTRAVQVRRLDDVVQEHTWPTPFILKVDTEGHDLEVLEGAVETLRACAVVYCETSLSRRFDGGYRFADMSRFMFDQGFDLVDVLDAPRARDGRTAYLDCVWVPIDS
jgi:FkbM family methyltransferase